MLAEPVKHREIFGFGIKKGNQTICKWRHLLTIQFAVNYHLTALVCLNILALQSKFGYLQLQP